MSEQLAYAPPLRRVRGLGRAATIMIGAVVVTGFATTWTTWHGYSALRDYLADIELVPDDELVSVDDLVSADDLATTMWIVYVATFIAAGIVFATWLWHARANSERLCAVRHRRAKGWTIGSWICPVVNLWFPYMVVDDVYRASRPDNPPLLRDLRTVPGSPLLGLWWTSWLGAIALNRIAAYTWDETRDIEALRAAAITETVQSVATLCAALSIIPVIRQINVWQDDRTSHTA